LVQSRSNPGPSILDRLDARILKMVIGNLDFLALVRLRTVSRWFYNNIDLDLVPEEDKIAGVMEAERDFKRYRFSNMFSTPPTSDGRQGRDQDVTKQPGEYGCYHCFTIKEAEEFGNPEEEDEADRTPSPRPAPAREAAAKHDSSCSTSFNPHYDPSITRSSLAASRRSQATNYAPSQPEQLPRIRRTTLGIRRFCVQCGIKKRYYRPGDLIELLSKSKENKVWVCKCWKLHRSRINPKCEVCKDFMPLSKNGKRRS